MNTGTLEFVVNNPSMSCCGRIRSECNCSASRPTGNQLDQSDYLPLPGEWPNREASGVQTLPPAQEAMQTAKDFVSRLGDNEEMLAEENRKRLSLNQEDILELPRTLENLTAEKQSTCNTGSGCDCSTCSKKDSCDRSTVANAAVDSDMLPVML